ncbi:type II restriction endonuclease [Neisseria zoodegmatis]|uniref:Type II restriction endonuclease n=1 Tax=Neisseria zoodegmatis TaxID=326523 RepID=A0A378WFZ5_9NEIS|nr:HNH endonuclease signature motif containing protein [Neisseria zoodegmatis]SUA36229.1 type II restriction endonuclease [Neisseria zoodegmatis]
MSSNRQILISEEDYIWKDLCRSKGFDKPKIILNSFSIHEKFKSFYKDGETRLFRISFPECCNIEPIIADLYLNSGKEIKFTNENKNLGLLFQQLSEEMGLGFYLYFQALDIGKSKAKISEQITPPIVIERMTKQRTQQNKYRSDLLKLWGGRCAVTGINFEKFLIASHIKKFSGCQNNEAYDKANGLLLCAHLDKLFDEGYITFDKNGALLISEELENTNLLNRIGVPENARIQFKYLTDKTQKAKILRFLELHREEFLAKL